MTLDGTVQTAGIGTVATSLFPPVSSVVIFDARVITPVFADGGVPHSVDRGNRVAADRKST
ncbi:hypothetical protein ACFRAQ_20615 [Nocardia sp. NPDC056611]|uniref:hypothetical protein n=1 Tax=Nocardia sp. NPDC056611 TaxID=3345877 RepID=UPI00366FFC9F